LKLAFKAITPNFLLKEERMRKASGAVAAMIMAIALYFTLFWGFDALRVLTSPTYGLEDVWRSQFVFGVGRMFGLGPEGLIKLAAFFGVMKLATAAVFAVHIADRFRCMVRGKADTEILEAGLILAVLLSIAAVAPALWSQNGELVREQTIQLLLAGLAAALVIIERTYVSPAEPAEIAVEAKAATPRGASWFSPWR
jgi:hypothetical protein